MSSPPLSLGVLLFIAGRDWERRIMAGLADAGFEASYAQGRIAARLDDHGVRLTELAEMSQVTKQSAGFLVDQLERLGYAERVPDPTDARARLIRLAPRGVAAQQAAREIEAGITAEWSAYLGSDAMAALTAALERLRDLVDPYADRPPAGER